MYLKIVFQLRLNRARCLCTDCRLIIVGNFKNCLFIHKISVLSLINMLLFYNIIYYYLMANDNIVMVTPRHRIP